MDKHVKLFKGSIHDHSKILKIMQYVAVVTSEFGLFQYHLRGVGVESRWDGLIGGPSQLTDAQHADLKARWKALGSSVSTCRMITRFALIVSKYSYW